ncbi:hypothetical protein B0H14DRAFT_2586566 [Mycena olivaceomarginata]|nr:hypothetical protein B0H14DRAFT_2586566 [Mycena olivaceomarginata]
MSIDVREEVNGTCSSTINVRLPARHRTHSRFQPMLPLSTTWVESQVERSETPADQISNWVLNSNVSIDVREEENGTCNSPVKVRLPARHCAHSRFGPMLSLSTARVESRVERSEMPDDQISNWALNVNLPATHCAHSRFQPMLPVSTTRVERRVEKSETYFPLGAKHQRHRVRSRFQPMLPLSTARVESRVESSEMPADQISNWAPDINMRQTST